MRTLKNILVIALAAVFFAGCAKSKNDTNTTTTTTNTTANAPNTTSTTNANNRTSGPTTMPTLPPVTLPPNTSTSSTPGDNGPAHTSSGEGETFRNQSAGVQFTLPGGWTSKEQGDSIIANSPMDAVSVVIQVPQAEYNQAVKELGERLERIIKNGKVTSPGKETTHNGMRAFSTGGTGQVNGQDILWEVDILQANKPFFVLTFAAPEMFKMHQGEYQQLLNSIKRIE